MWDAASNVRLKKVVLVGGSTLSRVMVDSILTECADFVVVGAVGGADDLAVAADELRPDLVIVDLCLQPFDGAAVLRTLRDRKMMHKVILSNDPPSASQRDELKRAGASAFFLKKEVADAHETFRQQLRELFDTGTEDVPAAEGVTVASPAGECVVLAPAHRSAVTATLAVLPAAPVPLASVAALDLPPADEDLRIAALHALGIANLDPDQRLDLIVRHLCHVTGYPMAAVNLIDESVQWTKAAHGLGRATMPRADAICNHTIRSTTPLIIGDTHEHPLFAGLDCVLGPPRIRSYVGIPLVVECGLPIGALCLFDSRPRALVHSELRVLSDMADLIVTLLDPREERAAA